MFGVLALLLVAVVPPPPARGQPPEGPRDSTVILLGFSYNYDTYVWSDSLRFRRQLNNRTIWGLAGGLSSTEISSGITRKQRFVSGRTFLSHQFSRRISGGFSLAQRRHRLSELANRHYVFSDFLTRLQYTFSPLSTITQQTGFSLAERLAGSAAAHDAGFTSETAVNLQTKRWRNRSWQTRGSLKINRLENVPSIEGRWGAASTGAFFLGDSLTIDYADLIRDTRYYPVIEDYRTIARQKLRDGHFAVVTEGGGPRNFSWRLMTDYSWRRESYRLTEGEVTKTKLLPLGLRQTAGGYRMELNKKWQSFGKIYGAYRYAETTDDFGEDIKDQNSETGELELGGFWRLGRADSLSGRVLWKVVSFIVPPDSSFFTDRDLSTRLAELSWIHRFSPVWETVLSFSYRGFRQAFLSGRWSGDNNHNDVYLFSPQLFWRPVPGWLLRQVYRIQANYFSYDFEKGAETQPERSTLHRRGEAETLLQFTPLNPLRVELRYTYRYEDYGLLVWREKWNQLVSWDRRSHVAGLTWRIIPYHGWSLAPGLYFEQKRSYDHRELEGVGQRIPRSTFIRRRLEFTALWFSARGRDDLKLSGSRRIQKSGGGATDVSDWVELTYRRHW